LSVKELKDPAAYFGSGFFFAKDNEEGVVAIDNKCFGFSTMLFSEVEHMIWYWLEAACRE